MAVRMALPAPFYLSPDAADGPGSALVRLEDLLPKPDRLGRDLDELVLADKLNGLLEVQQSRRNQPDRLVGRGSSHVRQLFLLDDVDVSVARSVGA